MNRIVGIIVHPGVEWSAIAREPASVVGLLATYVLPLCLVPSAAIAMGVTFFGAGWNPVHGYALARDEALAAGAATFCYAVITILLLALIFHFLARAHKRPRSTYAEALQVAAYGAIPVLLSGAFLVFPVMVMLSIVACIHSLFLLNGGLRTVLRVEESESAMLVGISIVLLTIASMAIGAIAAALGLA
ncbi:MAG: YIP1 family protein [Betaproteobacteria bacterium]|nr:YIP1 family protein [Betaproteobacteria bacterium]